MNTSDTEPKPRLDSMHVYPVKSCRGIDVEEATVDPWGLEWDRAWMLVDDSGSFMTQRTYPSMARITTELTEDQLVLSAPDMTELRVDKTLPDSTYDVEIWGDHVEALDEGDEAAGWFSESIGTTCRLVRKAPDHNRDLEFNPTEQSTTVGFADTHPFLLVTKSSVEALNEYLENPITYHRFRPNFVIDNTDPFDEDYWKQMKLSGVTMDLVRTKPRCKVITVDQLKGEVESSEPLELLTKKRKNEDGVLFGRELVHHSTGATIRRGATVEVLKTRKNILEGEGTIS